MEGNGAWHLRARFWNFAKQCYVELARHEITDEIAPQLIPQDRYYQGLYAYLRMHGATPREALLACLQAYQRHVQGG